VKTALCVFAAGLLVTVAPVCTAAGQQPGLSQAAPLDAVLVTASPLVNTLDDVMQSVSVMTREEIETVPAATLGELLARISGVEVRRRGGPGVQADIGIRGTAYEQTLVLVDGVPLGDPQTGHHNFNVPVPVEHIERIEIIKGPGGIAYGGSATGGLINIVTRSPTRRESGLGLRAGSHRAREGEVFGAVRAGTTGHLFSAAHFRTDGHEPERRADAELMQAAYTGQAELGHARLRWGLAADEKHFGAWKFYTADFPDQRERTDTRLGWLGGEAAAQSWMVSSRIWWRGHGDWFRTRVGQRDFINRHDTDVYGLRLSARRPWAGGVTAIGGGHVEQRIESNALEDHRRDESTMWLAHRHALGDRLQIEASLGVVDYSDHGTQTLPSLGLEYAVGRDWSVHAATAATSRIPSYTELFLQTSGNRGSAVLVPERSGFHELGVRYRVGPRRLSLTVFERRTRDLIDWARAPGELAWQAGNFDGHRSRGAELEWLWRSQGTGLLEHLRLSSTWLDTRLDHGDSQIKYALDFARFAASAAARVRLRGGLGLSVQARYQQRSSDPARPAGREAFLISARLDWQRGPMQWLVEGTNLLDDTVVEAGFAPLPGRWLYAGLRLRY